MNPETPVVRLFLSAPGPGPVGASRLGGEPDLPDEVAWPGSGEWSYVFVAQINLAEIPGDFPGPLPRRGMLYLFLDDGSDSPAQVVYWNGVGELKPRRPPGKRPHDMLEGVIPHQLELRADQDLPAWTCWQLDEWSAASGEDEIELDEQASERRGASVGQLLGYARGIGHDPCEDAFVVRDVDPQALYDYTRRAQLDMTPARHWRNLLMIDSNRDSDLCLGDAGYVHVLIREQELEKFDLSRVYVALESS